MRPNPNQPGPLEENYRLVAILKYAEELERIYGVRFSISINEPEEENE